MRTLGPGENVSLTRERPNLAAVNITVSWTTNGDATIKDAFTVCAFACDDTGRVHGDESLVFFNQPASPDGAAALTSSAGNRATFNLSLTHATFTTLVVAGYVSEGIGARRSLGQLGRLTVAVSDPATEQQIISSRDVVPVVRHHTAALLAQVYRRGQEWKFKATPDSFADGTRALMAAMGVNA